MLLLRGIILPRGASRHIRAARAAARTRAARHRVTFAS
jgi:hypothetical protein